MPTVKKRPGRKRGEVTADDVVAAAIDIVDRDGDYPACRRGVRAQPRGRRTATDRIEEKR